jgi:hypothetical protein
MCARLPPCGACSPVPLGCPRAGSLATSRHLGNNIGVAPATSPTVKRCRWAEGGDSQDEKHHCTFLVTIRRDGTIIASETVAAVDETAAMAAVIIRYSKGAPADSFA